MITRILKNSKSGYGLDIKLLVMVLFYLLNKEEKDLSHELRKYIKREILKQHSNDISKMNKDTFELFSILDFENVDEIESVLYKI